MVILGGPLTRLEPRIRRNVTGVCIGKSGHKTISATRDVTVNAVILVLQQILGVALVIA